MKANISCLIGLLLCLLSGCGTLNYIDIETYNPAEVTFPENVKKILVVNNSVPQSEDRGYKYTLLGKLQDTCKIQTDSIIFNTCRELGKAIVEENYFEDVLLYNDAIREDGLCYSDTKLTQDKVQASCNESGADAIVSYDRLLFDITKETSFVSDGYYTSSFNAKATGVVRSYLPQREAPLATIYVSDSLYWKEDAYTVSMLDDFLPPPSEALNILSEYLAKKVRPYFVPYWEKETRWYYKGVGTRWQEAAAYAANEKWDEASAIWKHIYERSSSWKNKAKTACNIALTCELKGDFKKAKEWADKSYALFKEHAGEKNNIRLLDLYVQVLSARIQSDKKLNMQIGQ